MTDPVNFPEHYKRPSVNTLHILKVLGIQSEHLNGECIEAIESSQLNFRLGSAVKYLWRVGQKTNSVEDLKKAKWYLLRELEYRRYFSLRLKYFISSLFGSPYVSDQRIQMSILLINQLLPQPRP